MSKFQRLIIKCASFECLWEEWAIKHFQSIGDTAGIEKQRRLSDERFDAARNRLREALDARKNKPIVKGDHEI